MLAQRRVRGRLPLVARNVLFCLRLFHIFGTCVPFRHSLPLCFRVSRLRTKIEVLELSAADVARGTEDEMHTLELRLDFGGRLHVEPSKHSRASALLILPRFLNAQRERMLHHLHQSALVRLRHLLGQELNDNVLAERGLGIHIG